MNEPIISVSGLRGIVGQSLDPLLAIRYTSAYISLLDKPGPVIVTRDGRATGEMLAQAVCSGISAMGRDVLYGNVAATPTTGILVKQHKAAAGLQISASHNPPAYNGIKLFGGDGRVIPADEGEQVIQAYHVFKGGFVSHDRIGSITALEETTSGHLRKILDTVDVEAIRQRNFKVVLDSNHGAGSILGRKLLAALNCQIECLGGNPDGNFEHPPEPTEGNLVSTVDRAIEFGADVVFCQDPDADRLAIIDETGNYIGEEYTLAITLNHRLQSAAGPVVINCSSSRMSQDICDQYGCELHLSAVGEANVTNQMIATNAVYGGEGNGGPIDPRVGLVRDSFVGMAQVLDCMAASGKSISVLVSELPKYEIYKTKIEIDRGKIADLFAMLKDSYEDAKVNTQDGLRLDWPDRWMLVRPSNTEPIVRAIAEARSMAEAQELCDSAAKLAAGA